VQLGPTKHNQQGEIAHSTKRGISPNMQKKDDLEKRIFKSGKGGLVKRIWAVQAGKFKVSPKRGGSSRWSKGPTDKEGGGEGSCRGGKN